MTQIMCDTMDALRRLVQDGCFDGALYFIGTLILGIVLGYLMRSGLVSAAKAEAPRPGDSDYPCNTCMHYLGNGMCWRDLEDECAAGGGFEAWEPRYGNTLESEYEDTKMQLNREYAMFREENRNEDDD